MLESKVSFILRGKLHTDRTLPRDPEAVPTVLNGQWVLIGRQRIVTHSAMSWKESTVRDFHYVGRRGRPILIEMSRADSESVH